MWTELLVVIARGLLQYYVDEYCTPAARRSRRERRRKGAPKEGPKEAPRPAAAEEPMHSAGWAPPKEAPLVNLIEVETDAGKTVAAASFIGEECFGVTRVQRERQPGESRRTRRKTPPAAPAEPAAAVAAPIDTARRDRFYAEAVERMREWGHAEHARKQAEAEAKRQAEAEAEEAAQRSGPSTVHPPVPLVQVPRTRPAGTPPLAVSGLTTETLVLLELGEPLTYVCAAA